MGISTNIRATKLNGEDISILKQSEAASTTSSAITDMNDQFIRYNVKLDNMQTHLDDLQEKNYAFLYTLSQRHSKVSKLSPVIRFDRRVSGGTYMNNGEFVVPIDGLFEIKYQLNFYDSSSYFI